MLKVMQNKAASAQPRAAAGSPAPCLYEHRSVIADGATAALEAAREQVDEADERVRRALIARGRQQRLRGAKLWRWMEQHRTDWLEGTNDGERTEARDTAPDGTEGTAVRTHSFGPHPNPSTGGEDARRGRSTRAERDDAEALTA